MLRTRILNIRQKSLILLWALSLPAVHAQNTPKPDSVPTPALADQSLTKIFELKYVDPEQLRALFASRSYILEANRDLRTLTVHGTPAFLKEVEDTVKRFDLPPPAPANLQITVYLLTSAAQTPSGSALPPELATLAKDLGGKSLKLADSQMMRLREGQTGEAGSGGAQDSPTLSRIRIRSASVLPGEVISLNGLQVWLNIPPSAGTATTSSGKTEADVSADIDVEHDQAAVISKAGVDKPAVIIVRATIVKFKS